VSSSWINWVALGKILGVGLLAGAGLPAVFAVGLRVLASGHHHHDTHLQSDDGGELVINAGAPGIAVAGLCFAVVLAGIGYGIYLIVKG